MVRAMGVVTVNDSACLIAFLIQLATAPPEPDKFNKLLAGMVRVMDSEYTGPFNIGNPVEFTMLELAQMVKEVVNPAAQFVYKENTADDPTRRKPDISKVPLYIIGWMAFLPHCKAKVLEKSWRRLSES
jgi:nucleoside-diphosphate-sugar epimerase